jgi:hypothetical protein
VVSQTTYLCYGLYDAGDEADYGESYPSRHEAAAELASLHKRYGRDRVGEMEVQVRHQGSGVLIVTSAPEDYDGFSTVRLADLGEGMTLAVVEDDDLSWQLRRYGSGMEVGVTLAGLITTMQGGSLYEGGERAPNGLPLWAIVPVGVRTFHSKRTALSGELAIRRALEDTRATSLSEAAVRTFPAMKALQREKNEPWDVWLDRKGSSGEEVATGHQPPRYNLVFVGDLFAATSDVLGGAAGTREQETGQETVRGELPLGPLFAHPTPAERRDGK